MTDQRGAGTRTYTKRETRPTYASSGELKDLLYACGDVPQPLNSTVRALDEIASDFIIETCYSAVSIASYSRRTKLKIDDFKWAIRRNERMLGRVTELLEKDNEMTDTRKMIDAKNEGEVTSAAAAVAAGVGVGAKEDKDGDSAVGAGALSSSARKIDSVAADAGAAPEASAPSAAAKRTASVVSATAPATAAATTTAPPSKKRRAMTIEADADTAGTGAGAGPSAGSKRQKRKKMTAAERAAEHDRLVALEQEERYKMLGKKWEEGEGRGQGGGSGGGGGGGGDGGARKGGGISLGD
ncbi:MAG: Transcription initiation factor TFIID subunit 13 [Alyxoria varia]|nr:MAG: Transcription initiation factor TFIID subunit 13 [Alyxoria varia]